ncbi:MAG TPA: hypothetical protein VLF63_03510 [Patescibacteria group bacterium]|nr:hypothetical protein [Patescibacteria group bacterium]
MERIRSPESFGSESLNDEEDGVFQEGVNTDHLEYSGVAESTVAESVVLDLVPTTKRERPNVNFPKLLFNFSEAGIAYSKEMDGQVFTLKAPEVKLLFGIAQANTFKVTPGQYKRLQSSVKDLIGNDQQEVPKNAKEIYTKQIIRIVNKGLPEIKHLDEEAVDELIEKAIEEGLVIKSSKGYRLTKSAMEIIENEPTSRARARAVNAKTRYR